MTEVNLLAALAAGTLSLLSPCSALLLPSFFAYAFASRTALMARTGVFYLGL
jgi:cytochrome c biogenesis protein CcdA